MADLDEVKRLLAAHAEEARATARETHGKIDKLTLSHVGLKGDVATVAADVKANRRAIDAVQKQSDYTLKRVDSAHDKIDDDRERDITAKHDREELLRQARKSKHDTDPPDSGRIAQFLTKRLLKIIGGIALGTGAVTGAGTMVLNTPETTNENHAKENQLDTRARRRDHYRRDRVPATREPAGQANGGAGSGGAGVGGAR